MGANQLCRIMVGISSKIGRDGHRDMGDVSTYEKFIRNLLGSMKPPGSNLCADTQRYKYLRASKGVKTEREPALRPFLQSDTETDFPRPVRSAKRLRFADTVFVRIKPVNFVSYFPPLFMFLSKILTDKTKTDFLHILVRTHLLVLTCHHSCMLLVIIVQIYRKRSRSILIMVTGAV